MVDRVLLRRVLLLLLALLLVALGAEGQVADQLIRVIVADLPAVGGDTLRDRIYVVIDGDDASDCTLGGGSDEHICFWNETTDTWQPIGSGGGGGGPTDKIIEANSRVEVIDLGTGTVEVWIDGVRDFVFDPGLFRAEHANGPVLFNIDGDSTAPTLVPDRATPTTGVWGGVAVGSTEFVGLSAAGGDGSFYVVGGGGLSAAIANVQQVQLNSIAPTLEISLDDDLLTEADEYLFAQSFHAADDGVSQSGASFTVQAAEDWAGLTSVPTKFTFSTAPSGSITPLPALVIESDQSISVTTDVKVGGVSTCLEDGTNCGAMGTLEAAGRYDPLASPPEENCFACDEFDDGAFSLTWTASATAPFSWLSHEEVDVARLQVSDSASATVFVGEWTPLPSSGDWLAVTRMTTELYETGDHCGLWVLSGGTTATPTEIYTAGAVLGATLQQSVTHRLTSYTVSAANFVLDSNIDREWWYGRAGCYAMKYTDSTDTLVPMHSPDCQTFRNYTSTVFTEAAVTQAGVFCDAGPGTGIQGANFDFFRILDGTQVVGVGEGLLEIGGDSTTSVEGVSGQLDYDPDAAPPEENCYACEEFHDGAESQTWRWGNQGTGALYPMEDRGAMFFLGGNTASTNEYSGRWTDAPTSGNYMYATKVNPSNIFNDQACGIAVLTGGTEATPTEIYTFMWLDTVSTGSMVLQRWTSYTNLASTVATAVPTLDDDSMRTTDTYLTLTVDDTSDLLSFGHSFDGTSFRAPTALSVTEATRVSVGYGCNVGPSTGAPGLTVHFARILDSFADVGAAYLIGGTPTVTVAVESGTGGEYHIDNPPADVGTSGCADEFSDGAESCTWENGNAGVDVTDSDQSLFNDGAWWDVNDTAGGAGAINLRGRWLTTPSSGDWIAGLHADSAHLVDAVDGCGMATLLAGTVATPTDIGLWWYESDGTNLDINFRKCSSYTSCSAATVVFSNVGTNTKLGPQNLPLLIQTWIDSTDNLVMWSTLDAGVALIHGMNSVETSDTPTRVGYFCNGDAVTTGNDAIFAIEWFRVIDSDIPTPVANQWQLGGYQEILAVAGGGGGGGTGDITDVWGDVVGGVDALVAAAGDSLDAALADASSPCGRSTTLPATCTEGQCYHDTDTPGTGASEIYFCTATNTWTSLGTSATVGDITDVWTDTAAGVDALTAAAGDSLDAGSADAASPCTRSTTLPATCSEGQCHQDTNSTAPELYICTATNTWTSVTEGGRSGDGIMLSGATSATLSTSVTNYFPITGVAAPTTTEGQVIVKSPAITPTKLSCYLTDGTISSGSYVMTLRDDTADSDWSCTITSSSCTDITGSVIAVDSALAMKAAPSSPSTARQAACFLTYEGPVGPAGPTGESVNNDSKCINIDPDFADTNYLFFRAEEEITVQSIDCIVAGATSVEMTLRECDADGGSCVDIESEITCAATNTTETSSVDNAVIDAGDWVRVVRDAAVALVEPSQAMLCVNYVVGSTKTKCITVDPDHLTSDWLMWRTDSDITIQGIDCLSYSGVSAAMTVKECDANGGSCSAIEAAITCATTNSSEAGGIDNSVIEAGDWIRVERGAVSGSVDQVSVCVNYVEN